MKKYFQFLLLCFFSTTAAFAQHNACGTAHETNTERLINMPYFKNMIFLENLVDSVNRPVYRYAGDETVYQIPVKFWLYEDFSTPDLPLLDHQLEARLNEVNEEFARMGVSIFLYSDCDIPVLEDADMATSGIRDIHDQRRGSTPNATTNNLDGAINFHFVENLRARANAVFPWNRGRYTIVSRYDVGVETWAHEIGHTLGLLHVHGVGLHGGVNEVNEMFTGTTEQVFFQEPRNNQRITPFAPNMDFEGEGEPYWVHTGDLLEDTPGTISQNAGSTVNCDINAGVTDFYNEEWRGNGMPRNIMSWSDGCRNNLTPHQIGTMYFWAAHYANEQFPDSFLPRNAAHYINPNVDSYENDNHWQNARKFSGNPYEDRSFHSFPSVEYVCDEDWVYFEVENQRSLVYISTTEVPNLSGTGTRPSPPMRMELFRMDWPTNTLIPVTLQTSTYTGNTVVEETDVFVDLIEDLDTGRYFLHLTPNDEFLSSTSFYRLLVSQNEDIRDACVLINGTCHGGASGSGLPTTHIGALCGNNIPLEIQGLSNPPNVRWSVNVPDLTVTSGSPSRNPATLVVLNPSYRGAFEVTATLSTASGGFIGDFRFIGWYDPTRNTAAKQHRRYVLL